MREPETRGAAAGWPCVDSAWRQHEAELRGWLLARTHGDEDRADDLLQTVFLKALRHGERFCAVEGSRAWLFTVARNALIDEHRRVRPELPLPADLDAPAAPEPEPAQVESLCACLPRALSELDTHDADVLQRCDLEGMTQGEYASLHGLSVPGAKSRLQRARRRLAAHLESACQVRRDDEGRVEGFTRRPPPGDAEG